jgi:uncharacterized protein YydD (DUF2326 family)
MLLHKLYSEPLGLFQPIEFKNGVNFIFAKKDHDGDARKSLNGVGKSLLLNFLDYALLSSETVHIRSAKKNNNISNYFIVLEFKKNGKLYIIKRSLETPNKNIMFGEKGGIISIYDIPQENKNKELNKALCELIFKNDYNGVFYNTWLRKLMPFFVKKQENPKTKIVFSDPIKFSQSSEMELMAYHLFFMGIDNTLFWKNYTIESELKRKVPALKEVRDLVIDTYGLNDISQAENQIDKLKQEVCQYEKNIKNFKLADQYRDIEEESNNLTAQIKELWFQNHLDNKKIQSYKESFELGDFINTRNIEKIYSELNELLASNIKKTLDDAIKFRKNIASSRKKFLASEIKDTEAALNKRSIAISQLEDERTKLYEFLEAKEAIRDLSMAYLDLSTKREKLSDLLSKIKTFRDLESEVADRGAAVTSIYSDIVKFIRNVQPDISNFRKVFFDIHNAIYPENKKEDFGFKFEPNEKKDSKVNINVYLPAELSKGKNLGSVLLYDLSILFHAIENKFNLPHFLVHDGIFDGMDKAHFVSLYEYLEKKSKNSEFQYIVTINAEGTLTQEFGNADKVTPEKIEEEAIITLTPSKKLLNAEWA